MATVKTVSGYTDHYKKFTKQRAILRNKLALDMGKTMTGLIFHSKHSKIPIAIIEVQTKADKEVKNIGDYTATNLGSVSIRASRIGLKIFPKMLEKIDSLSMTTGELKTDTAPTDIPDFVNMLDPMLNSFYIYWEPTITFANFDTAGGMDIEDDSEMMEDDEIPTSGRRTEEEVSIREKTVADDDLDSDDDDFN